MNKSINKINLYENAVIIYNSGEKEIFEAIKLTDKGIYTGIIIKNKNQNEEFIDDGLISKENVKRIIILDKNGKSQIIF